MINEQDSKIDALMEKAKLLMEENREQASLSRQVMEKAIEETKVAQAYSEKLRQLIKENTKLKKELKAKLKELEK